MLKYEKTILKIENIIHPKVICLHNSTETLDESKINPQLKKVVAKNLYDVLGFHFNKRTTYRGDYYPEHQAEN